ncbi:hypothetical protein GCM10023172_33800 [Hymenobacter ginsengisoli]|uniref:Cupin type-2 domain-containing protein n=1 Tax=Hymenobacter ginsengisoli TaxID=1051626 RepID=A0ABP8QPW7_9BACT|nr:MULTISPECIES: quercetin 2,3-dioxygenase [unclassified Hymenobacter]MBO2031083.1 quercetin 2,3-dioxygenase [Hymenobacter sp. BT559]
MSTTHEPDNLSTPTNLLPYLVPAAAPRQLRWYMGGLLRFLATAPDTGGLFSLFEVEMRQGAAPPRHLHTHEDESFYVLAGELEVCVGDVTHQLRPGDFLFLPRQVPHNFRVLSETARFLNQLAPAGLERLFLELGTPTERAELPPRPTGPPPAEFLARVQALQYQLGIRPA